MSPCPFEFEGQGDRWCCSPRVDLSFTEIEFETVGSAVLGHETENSGQNLRADGMYSYIIGESMHGGVWSGGEDILQVVKERVYVYGE